MNILQALETTAADYIIYVDYQADSLSLKLSAKRLAVLPGGNVLMIFRDLPTGWSPLVEFRDPNGQSLLGYGPFEQLIVGRQHILGVNAQPQVDKLEFRVLIQRGFGSLAVRDAAVIYAQWVPFDLTPERPDGRIIEVRVAGTRDGGTHCQ